nr:alkaline phytoceramidase [Betaproteobacteria bacterium]
MALAASVVSNAAVVLAGAAGLRFVLGRGKWSGVGVSAQSGERKPYVVFFLGALLTGFDSAWYHWIPDTERLTWDRLPMTLTFMSFLAAA